MALNKTSDNNGQRDVVQLVSPATTEELQMGINPEGMARILDRLTDLYGDPIEATVREVISNAIDATTLQSVGERKTIKITLPTTLRAAFIVEDFADGMSTEEVKTIYSQYGVSTKGEDFDQVGAYGLGAKAPLAYCVEFAVRTTKDGLTTNFTITRTPQGNFVRLSPAVDLDLPNGTRVTIPVKLTDAELFSKALDSYRKYAFDVDISINNEKVIPQDYVVLREDFLLDEASLTTGRVWIRRDSLSDLLKSKYARYPDAVHFAYVLSGWLYKTPSKHFYNNNGPSILVELKPGVVDFSSSRDAITANERAAKLDRNVTTLLQANDEVHIRELMRVYKTFDHDEAYIFFAKFIKMTNFHANEVIVNFNKTNSFSLASDDFLTHDGYNPLELMTAKYEKNLLSAFVVSNVPRGFMSLRDLGTVPFENLFDLKSTHLMEYKITDAIRRVKESVVEQVSHLSIAEFFLQYKIVNLHYMNMHRDFSQIVVITDADEKTTKTLLAARRVLVDYIYRDEATLVILAKPGEGLNEQVELVRNETGLTVVVEPIKNILTKVSAARKAHRATRTPNVLKAMSVRAISEDGESDAIELVAKSRGRVFPRIYLTVDELIDENAILVLSKHNHTSPLIGAANSGIKITNRPVYMIQHNQGLTAAHFKALRDYENIVAAPDFHYNCKDAQFIINRATYTGRILEEQLKASTLEEIVHGLVANIYLSRHFYKALALHGRKHNKSQRTLNRMLDAAAIDPADFKGTRFTGLSPEEVVLSLGKPAGAILLSLVEKLSLLNNSSTIDNALLSTLANYRHPIEGQVASKILDAFYQTLITE